VVFVIVLPVGATAGWYWAKGWPPSWRAADWTAAGIAPSPQAHDEPIIQVYAARAARWKSMFAVHTWIVVKPRGAGAFTRYEVVGWGTPLRRDAYPVDGRWFSNEPDIVFDMRGPQAEPVAINANGDPARFAHFELPVIADPIDGFVGPLAGVLAGLRWAASVDPGISHVVTASSDAPFLPSDLVARLADTATAAPGAIAIAQSGGHLHPVIGLWPVALADDLEAALGNGVRKVLHWTDRWGTEATPFPATTVGGEPCDPFFNANTPAELAEVRRLLRAATA